MPTNTSACTFPAQIPFNMWSTHHPVLHHITLLLTTAVLLLIYSPACTAKSTYDTMISLECKHA